jgi:phosphoribosyl 1,2-cyclic phosphodiesterase
MSLRLKAWGVRGSIPAPYTPDALRKKITTILKDFVEKGNQSANGLETYLSQLPPHKLQGYGGNTPCVEIKTDQTSIIIDGGSGIRLKGYELLKGPCGKGKGEVHIFFTHFHWDHLIGLPFFVPIFIPGNQIHVYSVQPDLKQVFETVFKKPYFPVPLQSLGAKIIYHQLEPRKPFKLGDITMTPYQLDHPDPCWGFKAQSGGRTYSHCVDTEAIRTSREELGPDLPLYQDVDLMVFDAQYSLTETIEKINWGHSAASIGLDIAMREGIKRVYFMHHEPASDDDRIAHAESEARKYYAGQLKAAKRHNLPIFEVDWSYLIEGQEIKI